MNGAKVLRIGAPAPTNLLPSTLPQAATAFLALVVDGNQTGAHGTGRLWGVGTEFGQFGYTDDDGTFRAVGTSPSTRLDTSGQGLGPVGCVSTKNYLWLCTGLSPTLSTPNGEVFVCAAPDVNALPGGMDWASGRNLTDGIVTANGDTLTSAAAQFTVEDVGKTVVLELSSTTLKTTILEVFDLAGQLCARLQDKTAGSQDGVHFTVYAVWRKIWDALTNHAGCNSTLRNSSFAVDPSEEHAFICEYGAPNAPVSFPPLSDGQMAAFGSRLFSAAGTIGGAQVGMQIVVSGAGAQGADLVASILSIVQESGPAIVELSTPAQTAVAAAQVRFATGAIGAGVIPGGPSVYYAHRPATLGAKWITSRQFPSAKHAHAIKIIRGLPWLGLGDLGAAFPGAGLWVATSLAAPHEWIQRALYSEENGGSERDPINMVPVTLHGYGVVLCESDNGYGDGPLLFADQSGTVSRVLRPTCTLPAPYVQTMRQLTLLPNDVLMWAGTGEDNSVGPTNGVWISRPPYVEPLMVQDVGHAFDDMQLGDGVYSNGYAWFGSFRYTVAGFR